MIFKQDRYAVFRGRTTLCGQQRRFRTFPYVLFHLKLTPSTNTKAPNTKALNSLLPRPGQFHGTHQRPGLVQALLVFAFRD
jgi:hypothetical protein